MGTNRFRKCCLVEGEDYIQVRELLSLNHWKIYSKIMMLKGEKHPFELGNLGLIAKNRGDLDRSRNIAQGKSCISREKLVTDKVRQTHWVTSD